MRNDMGPVPPDTVPARPEVIFRIQVMAALGAAALASLIVSLYLLFHLDPRIDVGGNALWLMGAMNLLGWTSALFIQAWSRRLALPPVAHLLIMGGTFLLGGVAISLSWILNAPGIGDAGWVAEAVGAFLGLILLWQSDRPVLSPDNLDDLLAPGFRLGPQERTSDRLVRAMITMALIGFILASVDALKHGTPFVGPSFASIVFWYGDLGSMTLAAMHFFMPRFLGRHIPVLSLSIAGYVLWEGGVLLAFGTQTWWPLVFLVGGGLLMLVNFVRMVAGAIRPRPRVVGSRRTYIPPALRFLFVASIVTYLLVLAAVPWSGPVPDGFASLVSAWSLGTFLSLVGHMAFIRLGWRYSPGTLAAAGGIWMLGWVLTLWHGQVEIVGSILALSGAVSTLLAFGRKGPARRDFQVLRGRTGA